MFRKAKIVPIPRKFSDELANEIREHYNQEKLSYREMALKFGCSHSTIEHIIRQIGAYKTRSKVSA